MSTSQTPDRGRNRFSISRQQVTRELERTSGKRVRCFVAVSLLIELRTTMVAARSLEREGADSKLETGESGVRCWLVPAIGRRILYP
jgi:hypothetical protein